MANFWFKLKLWTQGIVAGLLLLYVIFFTYFNSQEQIKFWYWFHHQPETNLLLFGLSTFAAGVVVTIAARIASRTLRQLRDMKMRSRVERLDRDLADQKVKAAMLQTKDAAAAEPAPAAPPPPMIEGLESRRQV